MRTLIRHQWRQGRSAFLAFGAILVIAACLLDTALTLLWSFDAQYDRRQEALAVADIDIVIPQSAASANLERQLSALDGVADVEAHPAVLADSDIPDFRGADFTIRTLVSDADTARRLNRYRHVTASQTGGDLYIPQYVAEFGQFKPGQDLVLRMDGHEERLRIAGTIEDMEFGNAGSGILAFTMPHDAFDAFLDRHRQDAVTEYAVRIDGDATLATVRKDLGTFLDAHGIPVAATLDRQTVRTVRTMVSRIVVLVLTVFALLVALVSLALCAFQIGNAVRRERVDMGILKAIGYTGRTVARTMLAPYLLASLAATLAGILLSLPLVHAVGSLVAMQSGLDYQAAIDLRAWAVTLAALAGLTMLCASTALHGVRRLKPIDAIRTRPAGRRRQARPLAALPGNARTAILLAQACASRPRNLLIAVMSACMTILLAFCATLAYNAALRPDNLYDTLSTETPQLAVATQPGAAREAAGRIASIEGVDDVLDYTTEYVTIDGNRIPAFVSDDFAAARNDIHYDGQHPTDERQIALGSALAAAHPIGSQVAVTHGDEVRSYTVVGFLQSVNDGGAVCELTDAGYVRLEPGFDAASHTLYVYCDGEETAQVAERIKDHADGLVGQVTDTNRMRLASQRMVGTVLVAVSVAILAIALFLVLLVLMMVVQTSIARDRHRLGILKAIGYTSRQLRAETAMVLLPAGCVGALLAAVLCAGGMLPAVQALFATMGVMRSHFELPWALPAAVAVLLAALQLACAFGFARPIRGMAAVDLIRQ
ncbi:ABC transporter permease [Bifidobacterium cuniculi]|uniref:Efflux ABC transporter, permease protein n=1 Tax=Bifidobacterium cuniculi TaxID=1688 RepID=A0A087B4B3_9BIFI|nr:FtsX-like permease family protein [Bifidobacterium cuniculi]KFI65863.1 efflux ABC transporter, permease protein [Bifidobacterium cuniculi]